MSAHAGQEQVEVVDIDAAARFCGGFDRQCDFGGGEKRVVAVRHENRAGMAAFAVDPDAQARWGRNRRDHSDFKLLLFEDRTLLYV